MENNLKEIRKVYNKNQSYMCNLLKIKQPTYSKLENAIESLTDDKIVKICKHFNISADYLLKLKTPN